jgi:hypothetical protein
VSISEVDSASCPVCPCSTLLLIEMILSACAGYSDYNDILLFTKETLRVLELAVWLCQGCWWCGLIGRDQGMWVTVVPGLPLACQGEQSGPGVHWLWLRNLAEGICNKIE